MNSRKTNKLFFVILLAVVCMFLSSCAKKDKIYKIGVLSGLDFFSPVTEGFKQKMTELGYVEGKNVTYDVQKSNIDMEAYRNIVKKFIADKVDLIISFPTEASMEAKSVTQGTGIPVIFINVFTENTNLINSVREPGGNITGVRWVGPDMALKRLEILRELVPQAKYLFLPYMKDYPIVKSQLEAVRQKAIADGLKIKEIPASNAAELEAALKKQSNPPDAILLIAEPLGVMPVAFVVIAKYADKHKIPVGGPLMSVQGYESIFGLTPQSIPQGKQAAYIANKVLKGTQAGTIPVVSAECFFEINYKAAQKLGLKVSKGMLGSADRVIK